MVYDRCRQLLVIILSGFMFLKHGHKMCDRVKISSILNVSVYVL